MKPPADGWDREEQEMLRDLAQDFEVLRKRHHADPPIELLRAARAGVLPDQLQEDVSRHLADNAWSRALVAGVESDGVETDAVVLDREDEARLLAHVLRSTAEPRPRESSWSWFARPAFLAAASCLILAAGLLAWRIVSSPTEETSPVAVTAAPSPAPTFYLTLAAPPIRLSTAVLTWRGAVQGNRLLADLEPGLVAFKNGDYDSANTALSRLVETYPNAFDVRYYQGISRLFVNDITGAIESLTAAERLADGSFAPDVAWYLAVAYERAGKTDEARSRLTRLCQAGAAHAADACAAIRQIR
jgi:tetratricopeptide (TPR) repeat protein